MQILSTFEILTVGSYTRGRNAKNGCQILLVVTCTCTEEEERMKCARMCLTVTKKSPGVGAFFKGFFSCFPGWSQMSYNQIFMTATSHLQRIFKTSDSHLSLQTAGPLALFRFH